MQCLKQKQQEKQEQQKSKEQQEYAIQVIQPKKLSLFKKKKLPATKLYSNVNLKHVININDVCFVNEQSLRNPDSSDQTLLKTLYHYKMISKVTLNKSFINIELKKNADNYLPPQYFIDRLRSFGDTQMANIATHLQKINEQFSRIKQISPSKQQTFMMQSQESQLHNFIKTMQGKKYFLYFSQITPSRIHLKNIIFSVPLLKALGCNLQNIAMDFLKYRHIFFEVFTTKNYGYFLENCLQNFAKIQNEMLQNPNMSLEDKKQLTSIRYTDQIIRQKQDSTGFYEQISKASVLWFAPHPSICCFQILSLDQAQGLKLKKKIKINHFRQTQPQQQLQALKRVGLSHPLFQISSDNENTLMIKREADKKMPLKVMSEQNSPNLMIQEQTKQIQLIPKLEQQNVQQKMN